MKRIIFILFFVISDSAFPQIYKAWFLNPLDYGCGNTFIGYANKSYYGDTSAIKNAFYNACENYLKQNQMYFHGGQAFWTTEAGTYWMGSNFKEEIDTSIIYQAVSTLKIIDTLITPNFVAVLTSDKDCNEIDADNWQKLTATLQPGWVNSIPQDNNFYYAVGIAPGYYYEVSSWAEAEKIARRNIASIIGSSIMALEKKTSYEYQEIKNEDIAVMLKNCEVVGRWRDINKKVFYVLMRIPKKD